MQNDLQTTLNELLPIFQDVFDDDNLLIDPVTTAQDVTGWDSLAHIRLIVTIEKKMGLRFTSAEISELRNVGEMCNLIISKR